MFGRMLLMPTKKGEKVEKLLDRMGKNPAWLARQLDVKKQSVYQWLEGTTPRDDSVWPRIAQVLQVDLALLEDDDVKLPEPPKLPKRLPDEVDVEETRRAPAGIQSFVRGDATLLPVWRGVVAGHSEECVFVEPDSPEFMEVPAFLVGADLDRHVVCIAAGTSMSPRIRQGERAIVRLDPNPPRNTIVVAEDLNRSRYIKALREKGNLQLHSLNGQYEPITDIRGWVLIGSVVAIWRQYEAGEPNIEWNNGSPLKA
jgi:phage repressor protein C with HTH and peptisase S24 domain